MTTQTTPIINLASLLLDPNRLTVSVAQAAKILGIAKSTASHAYRTTTPGFIIDGVPVLRAGKRCVVSTTHLRRALGLLEPVTTT